MKQALIILFYLMNVTTGIAQKKVIADPGLRVPATETISEPVKAPVKNARTYRNTDSILKARREAFIARTQHRRDSIGVKPVVKRTSLFSNNEPTNSNVSTTVAQNQGNAGGSVNPVAATAPDNNIDFTVTSCIGDKNAQTVTVYFTFSNTRKAHQKIWIGARLQKEYKKRAIAFDADGTQYGFGGGTLGAASSSEYRLAETQLPTGVPVKGSIKYTGVLSAVNKFSLVNIPSGSANWDGGKEKKEAIIEVKDLQINWQ